MATKLEKLNTQLQALQTKRAELEKAIADADAEESVAKTFAEKLNTVSATLETTVAALIGKALQEMGIVLPAGRTITLTYAGDGIKCVVTEKSAPKAAKASGGNGGGNGGGKGSPARLTWADGTSTEYPSGSAACAALMVNVGVANAWPILGKQVGKDFSGKKLTKAERVSA